MKIHSLILSAALILLSVKATAQTVITGKVVDDATGLAIAGASVYINNTSAGSISNQAGEFSFTISNITQGDLIVSSVGYEVLAFKVNFTTADNKRYLCRMQVKQQQLQEVLVISDKTRQRWMSVFRENFLGLTEEAASCNLKNDNAIYFTKGTAEGTNSFNAYCDTPLVIINKMLGYKISFQLIEFSFDEASGSTYYYGYTRFDELGEKKKYFKNRKRSFYGSTFHFYRALISNRLAEEGFMTYEVRKIKITGDSTKSIAGSKSKAVTISSSKPAESFAGAMPVTAADLVQKDTAREDFFKITIHDKLMVQYKKDPFSKRYLSAKVMMREALPVGVRSYITCTMPFYFVDKNGITEDPLSVRYGGYWTYEKAANMLPYNYEPDSVDSEEKK